MATSPYFNKFHRKSEQNLVDSLIVESIKIHGIDFVYLPRKLQKSDKLYAEDVISKFEDYYDIELYLKSFDGFQGSGDIMSKFGIEIKDQATLWMSRSRWAETVSTEMIRPLEGDLLYYPFNGSLFEIKFVANESVHYQLGELYVYELNIEQFSYSDEKFDTGIVELDTKEDDFAYSILLNLGAGAGTYSVGEMVYQGASLAAATAKAEVTLVGPDGVPAGSIKIKNLVGTFNVADGNVIGQTSGASYALTSSNDQDNVNDPTDDNVNVQTDADVIVDFSEKDPFSEDGTY